MHLAAADAGLAIPTDLAVTGWDDVMAARFVGLTTVRQPMRELGATAARWLHERITERSARFCPAAGVPHSRPRGRKGGHAGPAKGPPDAAHRPP